MLVQFSFKNYGSFKEETTFDMRAIKAYKEHPYNLIDENGKNPIIKVATIYGANASGKSTFVDAYHTYGDIIRNSFSAKNKEKTEPFLSQNYIPFLFDDESDKLPTEFEAIYDDTCIHYEWLYKKSLTAKRQVITTILERDHDNISLGASVKAACEKYVEDIDRDVLALSFFSSLKLRTRVFQIALECVMSILPVRITSDDTTDFFMSYYFSRNFDDDKEKQKLLSFLEAIDISIKDIEVEKLNGNMKVYTHHVGKNGKDYRVSIDVESDGTKKVIALYSLVSLAIITGNGLIIDELNAQLHPLLLKYIVDLFYAADTEGQLIYTTHDTVLLDKKYMRRDQIWFTDKNLSGESSMYSLAEFKLRNDQSFEKEYLGGSLGGIPILRDYSFEEE